MADIIGPTSHYFYSQRLKLHYVDWGNTDKPMAILVHGGRDHCRNWDWVALELRRHFHLIAPDLRGHGDSDWAIGGSYAMIDHVLDLYQLMNAIAGGPVNIEEALERMRVANPHLSPEQARHLTIHGVRRNENGTYSWKFDNYTRAHSPYLFNLKDATEIWSQIRCPTLMVRGDESWAGDWERDGRLDSFRTAELVTIRKAGHWVHHDQLAEFLAVVRRFLGV
jgi:pimeloyl-ACP methyl ester carboxylesterase